jgi:hypothetical protein
MSKFIYLYAGPVRSMQDQTEEGAAGQMEAWGSWIGKAGTALVDVGSPFGARASIAGDGTDAVPSAQNGYSIVEAEDLDAAKALLAGHPFITAGDPDYAVEVFELVPM